MIASLTSRLPNRRSDLLIRPVDNGDRYVVKDPRSGKYFQIGTQEHFLLSQLDGERTPREVCQAFEKRFGSALTEKELDGFVDLATAQGLVPIAEPEPAPRAEPEPRPAPTPAPKADRSFNLLYWRVSLFDPDRLFTRIAPLISFVWTRAFLVLSLTAIAAAGVIVWQNQGALISRFADALNWRTVLIVWITLLTATTLHEFAHGLTCKHYGGEVREVGFLMMFLLPCLYCNVSDAWLFGERRKRLLVTLAGGYWDLCVWALAVFAWRLTPAEGLANYVAWVVLSVLGARVFFNFNPLLKLDGYYLLSDWKGIPNLHQEGTVRAKAHLRHLLWGAEAPAAGPNGRFITAYGLASWAFSLVFLALMLVALFRYLWASWGLVALAVIPLGWVTLRGLSTGLTNGEVGRMITRRHVRSGAWFFSLSALPVVLFAVETDDRAGGPFEARAAVRAEIRAPVSGFLREVCFDEGDRVSTGTTVARLEVPDLETRIAQKEATAGEAEARLRLVEIGPRPEEIEEQRLRVERATGWRDRARTDLAVTRKALAEDLQYLDQRITECTADVRFARLMYDRLRRLRERGSATEEEALEAERRVETEQAKLEQARAKKRARVATGVPEAETELAKRDKELADARGLLAILQAGSRPEEVKAARAHLAAVREELRYLQGLREKLVITSPVGGVVTTPRPKDRVGHFVKEGDLICVVEDPAELEAEIAMAEQDVARVRPGQVVELRARALPFESVRGRVDRIAPAATRSEAGNAPVIPARGEVAGTVTIYCRMDPAGGGGLRPGMTGHARVSCGSRPVGELLWDRALRAVRTEFWW
ncbi:MAG TPA: HlyD family efflux transporter periplasmic adaptor subunit [Gemmataceae bacterium]|nr:HlyD family efflux transporter periplasmic adaptor subunit [Gemmataceae bacterium]